MATYEEYQALESSEKIILVKLRSSKRLMGWTVHSGSIYKMDSPTGIYLYSLLEDGTALSAVSAVPTGTSEYWHDYENGVFYIWTSDSAHPNNKFIAATFTNYYASSGGIHLSVNFSDKRKVHWIPLVKATSKFGFALDNKEFLGFALEGAGSVEFINDRDYWNDKFDKWYWDNQEIFIYSWNRDLAASEAKLIFRGLTQARTWNENSIKFKLKDTLKELRQPLSLENIGSYTNAIVPLSRLNAKQRILYGRVHGHIPSNVTSVLPNGNTLDGTASTTAGSATVSGSGTDWLDSVRQNDVVIFGDNTTEYTVASVNADNQLTLTEACSSTNSGVTVKVKHEVPNRFQNRKHLIAGHALKEPATTVSSATKINSFTVASDTDFFVGAHIKVGADYTVIQRVSNNVIGVLPSLSAVPAAATAVTLLSVWNVYLNENLLDISRGDYTFSAADATITLDDEAEFNIAPIKTLTGTATFTSGTGTVTGSGTDFSNQFKAGDWILNNGNSVWYEVYHITGATSMVVRGTSAANGSGTRIKTPKVYADEEVELTVSAMGATENGVKTGTFIGTAPLAAKDILIRAGLTSDLVTATFDTASAIAPQIINMVIPPAVYGRKVRKTRDLINKLNQSVFGSLYQNDDFQLEYQVIEPSRTTDFNLYIEPDILGFTVVTNSSRIVKDVVIEYLFKEYDSTSGEQSNLEYTHSSETAEYLAKNSDEFRLETVLGVTADAKIFAQRWAFIREVVSSVVKFKTALQASQLHIHDRVKMSHSKLYERYGSENEKEKLAGISSIKRDLAGNDVEIDDIGNAYARTAAIASNSASSFSSASSKEKLLDGYITDNYGLIDNDEDTYQINGIW